MPINRGLTNRVAISNAIDKELHSKLKAYSEETGIPMEEITKKGEGSNQLIGRI